MLGSASILALLRGAVRLRVIAPVLAGSFSFVAGSAGGQDNAAAANDRVIAVTGTGRVLVAPDQAVVSLGATIQRDEARDAQRELDAVMQRTTSAIRALDIPPENLQTAGLSLTPVYADASLDGPRDSAARRDEPRIVAYRATNILQVTIGDVAMTGAVIDAGIGAGINEIRDVSFRLADDLPYRLTALERAVEAARRKAETTASALGVRLGEPSELRERGTATPFNEVAFARAAGPLEPGELAIEVTVDATFELGGSQPGEN